MTEADSCPAGKYSNGQTLQPHSNPVYRQHSSLPFTPQIAAHRFYNLLVLTGDQTYRPHPPAEVRMYREWSDDSASTRSVCGLDRYPGVLSRPLNGRLRSLDIVRQCRVEPSVRSLAPILAMAEEEAQCPARFQFEREARDRCSRHHAQLLSDAQPRPFPLNLGFMPGAMALPRAHPPLVCL